MRPKLGFFKKILALFGVSIKVRDYPVRRLMDQFSFETGANFIIHITDVELYYQEPHYFLVKVRTHRPGLLIGKKGHQLEQLKDYLSDHLDGVVEFDITEEDMFEMKKTSFKHDQKKF